ncbi:MAG: penicillin-binding protein, partial [Burkholderiaceae bacterium]|nr:penicillin-binding protein [Burkholderiaceae bacterium]
MNPQNNGASPQQPTPPQQKPGLMRRLAFGCLILFGGLSVVGGMLVAFALAVAYPSLPAIDSLTDYRPKMPLRIYSADNVLIGEFGEERRNLVRIKDVPDVMKKAVLAIEDDRFYEHGGVDYLGILRAALHNVSGGARQGASTITQQVARNFFLTSEQTLKR